ncbi:YfcE family phosphodiesterase [Streptobacillus felis]|uniref:Phosphoesterase n=1 Tax=Streptobacillus felis TaxID=1384509 RepID=A0A7Z0PHD7_9FUSO|nr:YfcE family phosphodiesterase [Streptobacillus felis]NYV28045.1 YfcE family phosphodiesterase [Streptobacillus felis]
MKVLLCSDSHTDLKYFYEVITKEKPELIIFAGDHSIDAIEMSYAVDIPFHIVKGNCDYFDDETKETLELEIESMGKVILTHGHLFEVKSNMNKIYEFGSQKNANYVIFGHTHIQHRSEFNNTIYINPGAIVNHEYAIIENGTLEFKGGKK